jgi:hypothetical protein
LLKRLLINSTIAKREQFGFGYSVFLGSIKETDLDLEGGSDYSCRDIYCCFRVAKKKDIFDLDEYFLNSLVFFNCMLALSFFAVFYWYQMMGYFRHNFVMPKAPKAEILLDGEWIPVILVLKFLSNSFVVLHCVKRTIFIKGCI